MAEVVGIIQLEGRLGGLSFFKTGKKRMARKGWGPDKVRMHTDEAFVAVKEYGKEFGACSKAGKLMRMALRDFLREVSDTELTSRVTKLMFELKNLDTGAGRGSRSVSAGIKHEKGAPLLKDYNFRKGINLSRILCAEVKCEPISGTISMQGLVAGEDIKFPGGATHALIKGAFLRLDFEEGTFEVQETNEIRVYRKALRQDVVLKSGGSLSAGGNHLTALRIMFIQKRNGVFYALKNGAYNCSSLLGLLP